MVKNNNLRVFLNRGTIKGKILHNTRKKKDIIFGARSIQKQIGILARPTKDFDIFTNNSKKSARSLEKQLDKLTRGDNFFVKRGLNPTTNKVKFIGRDRIRNTRDDETIADFTKTPKPIPKFVTINEIRFRTLEEEIKAKQKLIRDPLFKFRRLKDLEDLRRIRNAGRSIRKG